MSYAQAAHYQILAERLYAECGAHSFLSDPMLTALERLTLAERRQLVHQPVGKGGQTPLGVAILLGRTFLVQYLAIFCDADLDLPMLEVSPDGSDHRWVPPLFICVAYDQHAPMLALLVALGANVNIRLRDGVTALWEACRGQRWDAVRYLMGRNACLNAANAANESCLMLCVSEASLVAAMVTGGALVNARTISGETALHMAAQYGCPDSVFQLLRHGADSDLVNESNQDALQVAGVRGQVDAFNVLLRNVHYTSEQKIVPYELMGCALMILHNDPDGAFLLLMAGQRMREVCGIPKVLRRPRPEFDMVDECSSSRELSALRHDPLAVEIQCLMVIERQLGAGCTILPWMLAISGSRLLLDGNRRTAMNLLGLSLRLHPARCAYMCCAARTVLPIMCEAVRQCVRGQPSADAIGQLASFEFVRDCLLHMTESIGEMRATLDVRPQSPEQQFAFEEWFAGFMAMVYAFVQLAMDDHAKIAVVDHLVGHLVGMRLNTSINHMTMLHHSVQANAWYPMYPSKLVTRVLLAAGANVDAMTRCGCTALHIACAADEPDEELIQLLVDRGAHIDLPNASGQRPIDRIRHMARFRARAQEFQSLRCMAANAMAQLDGFGRELLPAGLADLVRRHSRQGDASTGYRGTQVPGIHVGDPRRFCRCAHPVYGPPPASARPAE